LTFELGRRFTLLDVTTLRISELAERTGVPATTLRYYEDAGLLSAERTRSGYRMYGDDAVERLEFISSGKLLGLSLDDIRELVALQETGVCVHVRERLLALVGQRMEEADTRMAEVAAFKAHLARAHQQLSTTPPEGPCGPDCGCLTPAEAGSQPVEVTIGPPPMPESQPAAPVACTLDGASMGERGQDWRELMARAVRRDDTEHGIRVTFPGGADLAAQVSRLAADELGCCAFYEFTVELSPTAVVLEVRAPDEAAPLVAELFGASA
jgi:DNA-binding transcriptional MerR regulator